MGEKSIIIENGEEFLIEKGPFGSIIKQKLIKKSPFDRTKITLNSFGKTFSVEDEKDGIRKAKNGDQKGEISQDYWDIHPIYKPDEPTEEDEEDEVESKDVSVHSYESEDGIVRGANAYTGIGLDSNPKETTETSKSDFLFSFVVKLFFAISIFIWVILFYNIFQGNDPAEVMNTFLGSIWSPTTDPVFNFLINTIIIILGIPVVLGVLFTGLYLAFFSFLLGVLVLVVMLLVGLASISTGGAILATVIGIGIIILIVRYFAKK